MYVEVNAVRRETKFPSLCKVYTYPDEALKFRCVRNCVRPSINPSTARRRRQGPEDREVDRLPKPARSRLAWLKRSLCFREEVWKTWTWRAPSARDFWVFFVLQFHPRPYRWSVVVVVVVDNDGSGRSPPLPCPCIGTARNCGEVVWSNTMPSTQTFLLRKCIAFSPVLLAR